MSVRVAAITGKMLHHCADALFLSGLHCRRHILGSAFGVLPPSSGIDEILGVLGDVRHWGQI